VLLEKKEGMTIIKEDGEGEEVTGGVLLGDACTATSQPQPPQQRARYRNQITPCRRGKLLLRTCIFMKQV
jgi:hypothetical protein